LPLAFAQSYGMIVLLNSLAQNSIINTNNVSVVLIAMTIITAGTMFLMWL
jgi:preprotein translocase subunit SecY